MKKYNDIKTPQPPLGGAMRPMRHIGLIRPVGLMRLISLMGLISLIGLISCSKDSPEDRSKWVKLELVPYYNMYKVLEEEQATRRTRNTELFGSVDGDGPYVPYAILSPQADPSQSAIHVYLTKENEAKPETEGNFTFHPAVHYTQAECDEYNEENSLTEGNDGYRTTNDIKTQARWSSGVWLKEHGTEYFVYGFMPASAARTASITPNTDFNNRAILQLNGINAVTPADVCVVVGVKGLTKADHGDTTPIAESGITVGSYSYTGNQILKEDPTKGNYIYLLLDHLYSCLNLEYKVSPEYYKLRTIKLRKVEIKVTGAGAKKRNLTVTIPGTDSAPFDLADVPVDATTSDIAVIFDRTSLTEGLEIPSTSALSVAGYFTPMVNNTFYITSIYDVYDRKGNLIRANQKAENTITPNILLGSEYHHVHKRGQMHTLQFLIEPTYLYQLSDGDLDNPVIRVVSD